MRYVGRHGIGFLVLAGAAASQLGCAPAPSPSSQLEDTAEYQGLKNLGEMYRLVSVELKRPPKSIAELRQAEKDVPGGFSMLGETNVGIYFGVELPEVSGKPQADASATVLAYERTAPLQGGLALFLDRSVRRVTVEEFKAAKKAGAKPWVAPAGS